MIDSITEHEILAYIEDELTPEEADRIHRIVREHPDVLAAVERLREDRALLRSAPDPADPGDLLRDMESVLARPMLVDARPGTYRRRQRHQRRRQTIVRRMAVAAAVVLVFGGAVAALLSAMNSLTPGGAIGTDDTLVIDDSRPGEAAIGAVDDDAAGTDAEWPPPGGTIHHYGPGRSARDLVAARPDGGATDAPTPPRPSLASAILEPLPFALHVRSAGDAEPDLIAISRRLGADAALVRNFSFAEARELERQWLAGATGGAANGSGRPLMADAGSLSGTPRGDELNELARRMREALRRDLGIDRRPNGSEPRVDASKQLIGRPTLAPSLQQQLRISEEGGAYTITLPRSRLSELLRFVHDDADLAGELRMVLGTDGQPPAPSATTWARDLPRIRAALADLEKQGVTTVLLPIVIDE